MPLYFGIYYSENSQDDWYSPIVQDSFRTYVFLPPGYDTSSAAYPVLYLTDGDWLFNTFVQFILITLVDMNLDNKKILLIGGSHGMGLATARAVLAQNAQVTLVGRQKANLEAARNELVGNVRTIQGDITEIDSHEELLKSIDRFDHAFISASPGGEAGFNDPHLTIEASYLYGKVWCTFKFLQKATQYINDKGSITLMSGGYAVRSTPDYPLVSIAFAATEAMARALAASIAPIRVNAIRPTYIDQNKPTTSKTLTGTMGSTDDIGDAVAFLMGNNYINGETLNIDGGAAVMFT